MKILIEVFIKETKFCVFNFRSTFFSRDLNFAIFFKSQKSRKLSFAKISDNKVAFYIFSSRFSYFHLLFCCHYYLYLVLVFAFTVTSEDVCRCIRKRKVQNCFYNMRCLVMIITAV